MSRPSSRRGFSGWFLGLPPVVRLLSGFVLLLLIPTALFFGVEHFSPFDAFDLTVQTVFAVGYGNVYPKTLSGRIIADMVMIFGTGYSLYTIGFVASFVADEDRKERVRRKRMQKDLDNLKDHFIICGFGRVGREVHDQLVAAGKEVVVIERDPARILADVRTVDADATDDDVLRRCGIERAAGVVAALSPDSENVALVLAARGFSNRLTIVAKGSNLTFSQRLKRAGADHVVLPTRVGGRYLATLAIRPSTLTFFEQVQSAEGISVEEVGVPQAFLGKTLAELKLRERTGAMVVALWRGDRVMYPDPGRPFKEGDRLFVLGSEDNLTHFTQFSGDGD